MPLFWRPQLKIGHEEIDADHRYLILLINTVELVLRFPEQPQHIALALGELREYAKRHFEREEKIQIAWGYSHLDQHKVEHRRLLQALEELNERVTQALADPASGAETITAQSQAITDFLRKWLVDHVLKTDMQLAVLFKTRKGN